MDEAENNNAYEVNDDTTNSEHERTSLTKRISALIDQNTIINYNGGKYQVVGYQLLKRNEQKQRSLILKSIKANCIYWVDVNSIDIFSNANNINDVNNKELEVLKDESNPKNYRTATETDSVKGEGRGEKLH